MATVRKYRLLKSSWSPAGKEVKIYRAPCIVESSDDLVKMFGADKFQLIEPGNGAVLSLDVAPVVAAPLSVEELEKKLKEETSAPEPGVFGDEVTDKFPTAKPNGLKVFQTKDGEFNVTDETDVTTSINEAQNKKLKSEAKANEFIAKFLEK